MPAVYAVAWTTAVQCRRELTLTDFRRTLDHKSQKWNPMIRRINKLKNVGRFVDLKSQGGTQGDFAKVNVIYAPNAGGKTTLCDVFRSLGTGKPDYILGRKRFGATSPIEIEMLFHGSPAPKSVLSGNGWQHEPAGSISHRTLVYDDRFVADNVLIGQFVAVEHRRNVYGLALGPQAKTLKATVDAAEQELAAATTALNTARAGLTPLIPAGYTVDSFRLLARDEGIEEHIKQATEELEASKRSKANAEAIRLRKPLGVAVPPAIPTDLIPALASTLDDAAVQAESQVRKHLETHTKGLTLDWAGQGHRGQLGTACPHCGQEMDGLEILGAYRAFFSGTLQEQQVALERILKEAEQSFGQVAQKRWEQLYDSHTVERDWWKDAAAKPFPLPDCPASDSITSSLQAVHNAIVGCVQRKKQYPASSVSLSPEETSALEVWNGVRSMLVDYMAALTPINAGIAEWQKAAGAVDTTPIEKRLAALNAQKKRHEAPVVTAYAAFDAAVANKAEKDRAKATANNELREQSERVLGEYGGRINLLLERFGADFRLAVGGVTFHGGPPAGDLAVEINGNRVSTTPEDARNPSRPSLANTLSSGDRSALALAYFVAFAERDADIANTVTVFDDPFHSQDRSRRRRTIECVHRLAHKSLQCFILSHELDFAREVARVVGVPVNTFVLSSMTDHCVLQAGDLPPLPGHAYQQDYEKLAAYVAEPNAFTTQLKDVARCIRQTLEAYFRTKFPNAWEESDWLGDMIRKIREAQAGSLLHNASHLVADLTEVNDWGKRYYHGETDGSDAGEVDPKELLGYVKQTLGIISR